MRNNPNYTTFQACLVVFSTLFLPIIVIAILGILIGLSIAGTITWNWTIVLLVFIVIGWFLWGLYNDKESG